MNLGLKARPCAVPPWINTVGLSGLKGRDNRARGSAPGIETSDLKALKGQQFSV